MGETLTRPPERSAMPSSTHHVPPPAQSSAGSRAPAVIPLGPAPGAAPRTAEMPAVGAVHRPPAADAPRSEEKNGSAMRSLSPTSLIAGGAAAATASVVGGHLGVGGTVAGAALTSVVSAGAVALYTDSVRRSAATLKAVQRITGRRGSGRSRTRRGGAAEAGALTADPTAFGADSSAIGEETDGETTGARRRPWLRVVLTALAMGLIGLAVVFGVQRATGMELSPGTGQIQRSVSGSDAVAPRSTDDDSSTGTDTSTDGTDSTDGSGTTDGTDTTGGTDATDDSGSTGGSDTTDGTDSTAGTGSADGTDSSGTRGSTDSGTSGSSGSTGSSSDDSSDISGDSSSTGTDSTRGSGTSSSGSSGSSSSGTDSTGTSSSGTSSSGSTSSGTTQSGATSGSTDTSGTAAG